MRIPSFTSDIKDRILDNLRGKGSLSGKAPSGGRLKYRTLDELRALNGLTPVPSPHDDIVHALSYFVEASTVTTPADPVGINPCGEIPLGGGATQCVLGTDQPEEMQEVTPPPVKASPSRCCGEQDLPT